METNLSKTDYCTIKIFPSVLLWLRHRYPNIAQIFKQQTTTESNFQIVIINFHSCPTVKQCKSHVESKASLLHSNAVLHFLTLPAMNLNWISVYCIYIKHEKEAHQNLLRLVLLVQGILSKCFRNIHIMLYNLCNYLWCSWPPWK